MVCGMYYISSSSQFIYLQFFERDAGASLVVAELPPADAKRITRYSSTTSA
jgi:hypothetical protein